MWAAKAAKLGYRWKVGNGGKIKFWKDKWLGGLVWLYSFGRFTTLSMRKPAL
jgi:hypothetical protein